MGRKRTWWKTNLIIKVGVRVDLNSQSGLKRHAHNDLYVKSRLNGSGKDEAALVTPLLNSGIICV